MIRERFAWLVVIIGLIGIRVSPNDFVQRLFCSIMAFIAVWEYFQTYR